MAEVKTCAVCGKPTGKFLFGDRGLGVRVCSKKCMYAYLNDLSHDSREQLAVLRFLDESILACKRYNKLGWVVSGLGVVPLVLAFVFASAFLFIFGAVVVTVGSFWTRYFENRIYELTKTRKRIEI